MSENVNMIIFQTKKNYFRSYFNFFDGHEITPDRIVSWGKLYPSETQLKEI